MTFAEYYKISSKYRDIDPANDVLVYVANRWELNPEQRYWLAFLYSTCYSATTAYYMINEFPDFANVNVGRLERWWKNNKQRCIFQTDRLRIKTSNQFVPSFESYKQWIGKGTQQQRFNKMRTPMSKYNYDIAYKECGEIRNVGRFTLFIYLEMINLLTDFKCLPKKIDWDYADNCKTGLLYAYNYPADPEEGNQTSRHWLDTRLEDIQYFVKTKEHSNIFNVETVLCAYKKYRHQKRYVGYYLDRQLKEIEKMKENVPTGVCWRVMDEFRAETYGKLIDPTKLTLETLWQNQPY